MPSVRRSGPKRALWSIQPETSARRGTGRAGATRRRAEDYERDADSGYRIRFHFCPNCGSTLYWEGDRNPAVCGVAVGAFDGSAFPPPSDSIWEESMYS
jgi:hypothetical protein